MANLDQFLEPDDPAILEFDLACTLRLQIYDRDQERARFKNLAALLGAKPDDDPQAKPKNVHTEVW